jgi:uncharacterized protein
LVSNDPLGLETVAKEIRIEFGVNTKFLCVDLKEKDGIERLLEWADVDSPRLIINAAGAGIIGYFLQYSIDDYIGLKRLNEEAPLIITHHFASTLFRRKQLGGIINISTANTEYGQPIPYSGVYSGGKHFVRFFTIASGHELKPFGIDFLNVSCGPTATSFQKSAKTNTLSWSETAESVARKSLNNLGVRLTITTNLFSRLLHLLTKLTPFPAETKQGILGYMFKRMLARKGSMHLPRID